MTLLTLALTFWAFSATDADEEDEGVEDSGGSLTDLPLGLV